MAIELGLHTDNWRPLSGNFQIAAETAVKYGLKHIEFAGIHGQYFIQAMGYEPGISLQSPSEMRFSVRPSVKSSRTLSPSMATEASTTA